MTTTLAWIDYLIMLIYLAFVLGIGFALKKFMKTSEDFFLSGRSIPAWVAGLAFISANLGAQEVIGMAASGAKYGIATSHFYWLGAIPAMVFVGIFMMPFYYGSRAHSVPEYLRLRFDEKTRGLNAITFAAMTVLSSGISMLAMAKLIVVLHIFDAPFASLGLSSEWIFHASIVLSAVIVLGYVYLGGLTSAIYNEVLQFFLIVAGFLPLVLLGLKNVGGWDGLRHSLPTGFTHAWVGMSQASTNPLGVEVFGLAMGLGFVLSFGYWCTDFLVVQRAMAADSMTSARRTPLIAAIPKMFFPFLVIMPGLIAIALPAVQEAAAQPGKAATATSWPSKGLIPAEAEKDPKTGEMVPKYLRQAGSDEPLLDANGQKQYAYDYNLAIPNMLLHYFPTGMLGLGLTALLASFMSGMAGNITAFNTVGTYDIYKAYINRSGTDRHYIWIGQLATLFGTIVSIAAAYAAAQFNNIMDALQLVFGFVNAPLFATFLLGMFWKRTTGHGAFFGLLSGTAAAAIFQSLTLPAGAGPGIKGGWLANLHTFPSEMAQNFWLAIFAWTTCFLVTIAVSLFTKAREDKDLVGLVYSLTEKPREDHLSWYKRPLALGIVVLIMTAALNLIFY
ncbi:MAG: sodium:solute symporter family protein [Planctomycetaceae bacterium]|nr:sodium:solute symporter family protein [Planctomycetaceae bacterium]